MARIERARSSHRTKKTADIFGKKEISRKKSIYSGFFIRKIGNKYVNFYFHKNVRDQLSKKKEGRESKSPMKARLRVTEKRPRVPR